MIIIPQYYRNKLPKTGQTTSYATGDDGDIEAGLNMPATRFEVVNIGGADLVKDYHTGLMFPRFISKNSNVYWTTALFNCAGSVYGGFDDWRLPNIIELLSIFDFGNDNAYSVFECLGYTVLWSSTSYKTNSTFAWYLMTWLGISSTIKNTSQSYIEVRNF